MSNKEVLLYLNFLKLSYSTIYSIIKYVNPKELLETDKNKLDFLNDATVEKIFEKNNLEDFQHYKEQLIKQDIRVSSILDDSYPINLRNVESPPPILYYKGNLDVKDQYSISIVGSRKCSQYGIWATKHIVEGLKGLNIATVSGLALGIDTVCHKTSIDNSIRTIGVIGSSLDIIYPKSNRNLYEIMQKDHLIVSEYPLGTQPFHYNFPRRNRILAGLSKATLVVEAREKSGSLITANYAAEQGKYVFAIPGNINSAYSKGCNKLIMDGVMPVTKAEDIINYVGDLDDYVRRISTVNIDHLEFDSELEEEIYFLIRDFCPISVEKISFITKKPISEINMNITALELKEYIEMTDDQKYGIKGY